MMKAAPTKNDIGEIAYFLSALATPNPTVAHFTIEHDGIVEELDGICCMAGNTSVIQNDINLFPDCRMNDGMVDIAVIEPVKTVQLLPTGVITAALDPAGKVLGRPPVQDHPDQRSQDHLHPVRWACSSMAKSSPGRLWRSRASAMSRPHRRRFFPTRKIGDPMNDNPLLGFIVIVLAMLIGYAINVIHHRKK